jgi:predicted ArsR family transcriptional regulator
MADMSSYSYSQALIKPEKIKDQLLYVLKMEGAKTATLLADDLDVSPMAVRQHLQDLKKNGWVTYSEQKQPLGRPVKRWCLTDHAQRLFPNSHSDLVVGLLESAEQVLGAAGLDEIIRHRTEKQTQKYQEMMVEIEHWRDRTDMIAQLRTQEGYMAEVIDQGDGSVLLVENHCSICVAAQRCSRLCVSELEVFTALLGNDVSIQRQEHILAGDRRCAYHITSN